MTQIPQTTIVFPKDCIKYCIEGHPESPKRVESIYNALIDKFEFVDAKPAKKEDILLCHTEEHYNRVLNKDYFDWDTPVIEPYYPLLSAGSAIKAAKVNGFSLSRPPGHHAGRNSLEGFCYFNNICIATKKLGKRTAILDLDVHHGNGTEDIVFGDEDILYVSIHQHPLYLGTGLKSKENCINFPLPPQTDEDLYLKTLKKALEHVVDFKPEVLAISLGFDTYVEDPLANFALKEGSYEKIGKLVGDVVEELGINYFIVLEGGYSDKIGDLALKFFEGFVWSRK
jgi:acetoin utilization deacetylase AcuC-like enzyme